MVLLTLQQKKRSLTKKEPISTTEDAPLVEVQQPTPAGNITTCDSSASTVSAPPTLVAVSVEPLKTDDSLEDCGNLSVEQVHDFIKTCEHVSQYFNNATMIVQECAGIPPSLPEFEMKMDENICNITIPDILEYKKAEGELWKLTEDFIKLKKYFNTASRQDFFKTVFESSVKKE